MQRIGSRAQVMHGNAKMTGGGLKKKDLKYNKHGKIVSKKMSVIAKKYYSKGGHSENCNVRELIDLESKLQQLQQLIPPIPRMYSMDTEVENKIDDIDDIQKFCNGKITEIIFAAGDGVTNSAESDVKRYWTTLEKIYIFCYKKCYDTDGLFQNIKHIMEKGLFNVILCEFNIRIEKERVLFQRIFEGMIDVIKTDDAHIMWNRSGRNISSYFTPEYILSLLKKDGKVQKKIISRGNSIPNNFNFNNSHFLKKINLTSSNSSS
jgi:hypothetical protein